MEILDHIAMLSFFISGIYGIYAILRLVICLIKGSEKQSWIKKAKFAFAVCIIALLAAIAKDGLDRILCLIALVFLLIGFYMFIRLIISLFYGENRMKYLKRTGLCVVLFIVLAIFGASMDDKTNAAPQPSQTQQPNQQNQSQQNQNQQSNQQNQRQSDNDIDIDRDRNSKKNNSQSNRNESRTQNQPSQNQQSQNQPTQNQQSQNQQPQNQSSQNQQPRNQESRTQQAEQTSTRQTSQTRTNTPSASSSASTAGKNKGVLSKVVGGVKTVGRLLIKAKFHI